MFIIKNYRNNAKIVIKVAEKIHLYELYLCAQEYIELIDDFEKKFLNNQYIILTAYDNDLMIGILIIEDKSKEIDCLRKIVPNACIHLLYVNRNYRKKGLGKRLVNSIIMFLFKNKFASLYIKLPEKNKKGINFFLNNDFLNNHFQQKSRNDNKILLEMNLWHDFDLNDCENIQLDSFALY
ncbi:MAG: GNAT family N-acetyltransferase [Candidatus Lokiarchaeota archaeon]|nr:GNAT family N-acetyltransferase [Candidatus Lokiarchaeota archaeon]